MDFTSRIKVSYIIAVPGFEERDAKTTTRSMSNLCVACIAQMISKAWRPRGISWRGLGRDPARAEMAFRSENGTHRCGLCRTEERYFKLYCSERPQHLRVDAEGGTHNLRICKQCEQKVREDEWAEWTPAQRAENPKYTEMDTVNKAHKRQCKGERWYQAGLAMKGARDEINEEIRRDRIELNKMQVDDSVSCDWEVVSTTSMATASRKDKKAAILSKSKSLAFGLIESLMKCDMLMNGFSSAGDRMRKTADAMETVIEREVAWERSEIDGAKEEIADHWETAAERVADHTTYQTASEHGDNQTTFLKALDFADEVGPDIRIYNVCTQQDCVYGKCGLAFPSKLWWQKGVGTRFEELKGSDYSGAFTTSKKWSFKCLCEWGYLAEEAHQKPESEAGKWFRELSKEYGDDFNRWPSIGCKQGFRPFANGASCVMELKIGNEWQAFVSERLPPALDDEIKGRNYLAFQKACSAMTPQDIYEALPMCFPMTHQLTVNGKIFRGVARYPLLEWEEMGKPVMTQKSWAKFCMKVALNDMTNLDSLFQAAEKFAGV
jgi:hypothetical protein